MSAAGTLASGSGSGILSPRAAAWGGRVCLFASDSCEVAFATATHEGHLCSIQMGEQVLHQRFYSVSQLVLTGRFPSFCMLNEGGPREMEEDVLPLEMINAQFTSQLLGQA